VAVAAAQAVAELVEPAAEVVRHQVEEAVQAVAAAVVHLPAVRQA
jgi:hypothetical protein